MIFLISLLSSGSVALAQTPEGKINLGDWVAANYKANPNYHFTLAVLESGFDDAGDPMPADIAPDQVEALSMFRLVDSRSLAWDLKLNAPATATGTARQKLEKLTDATYYLFAPKTGKIVFAKRNDDGVIVEMFSGKVGKSRDWPVVFAWIQKKYGWDGIILAVEGNQMVAAGPAAYFQKDVQALAIAGSERTDVLTESERSGAGLLSLVESKNGFALFESVFMDESSKIAPGTKLIIEKRRK
jgi:hypothetical protein